MAELPVDTLEAEHFHKKNTFGLPEGSNDLSVNLNSSEEVESEESVQAGEESTQEEVVSSEDQTEVQEEEEELSAEDLIAALDGTGEELASSQDSSELDRLRREKDILEDTLIQNKEVMDRYLRATDVAESSEDVKEDTIDFTNPDIQKRLGDAMKDDPSTIPVIMAEMVKQSIDQSLKPIRETTNQQAQQNEARLQYDSAKSNLEKGLITARARGSVEKALVDQFIRLTQEGKVESAQISKFLINNPEYAVTPTLVASAVTEIARQARSKNSGTKSSAASTLSTVGSTTSSRHNDMLEGNNNNQSDELTPNQKKIESLLSVARQRNPLFGMG